MKTIKTDALKGLSLGKARKRRKAFADPVKIAEAAAKTPVNNFQPDLKLTSRKIESLAPAKRRVRAIKPEQIQSLVRSFKRFGFIAGILVKGNTIIDGHARLEAAKQMGMAEIPAFEVSHLTADECRLLAVSMNRIGETGSWDIDLLRVELIELVAEGFDLEVTGFELPELDLIIADPDAKPGDELDMSPSVAPGEPVTRLGDLWRMQDHALLCGSALDADSYAVLLGDEKVRCVLEDAPYNVPIVGNVSGLGAVKHGEFVMASGEMTDAEFKQFLTTQLTHCAQRMLTGAVAFAFMDWRGLAKLEHAAIKAGLSHINTAVWDKGQGGMGTLYRSAHEFVGIFCKGKTPAVNNVKLGKHGRDRTNIWRYPGANSLGSSAAKALKDHPTPKNVTMIVDALLDVTDKGDIVLDPFMGSGTTLIACAESLRVARGIELDPKYVDVTIRRWEAVTGEQARLAATGESFAEVAERRANETAQQLNDQTGE